MNNKETWAISGARGFIGSRLLGAAKVYDFDPIPMMRLPMIWGDTDVFVDLASYGNLYSQKDTYETFRANTCRVLELLEENNPVDYKAFIVTSSSSVTIPNNNTAYAASKRAAEEVALSWASIYQKPIVVVRPYSITGVGEQEEHLIPKLIDSCLSGTEVPFVPSPVHDFLDVEDFISGLVTVARNAKDYKGYVFPIGSGKQYSNAEVLELVEGITGKKANVKLVDNMRSYDTHEWRADTTLMYSLGWEPTKSLRESITQMVKDYEQRA